MSSSTDEAKHGAHTYLRMHGEGCPAESDTGKLDNRAVVRYLLGYKYEGGD